MVAPPPFRMQTRGRENIKAPVKYDGLVAHDNSEEELYRPTVAQRRSSAYRGKVIEFNPNLPPAAFPTLELGQRRESNAPMVNYTGMRDMTTEQTNRYLPCEMHRSAYPTPNTSTFYQTSLRSPQFRNSASTVLRSAPITPQSAYLMEKKWSNQGWKGWDTSNNLQNPVYANNLKTMKRLDARTEEDWNIAEMETSDEEGSSARHITSNGASTRLSPEALGQLWEELPVALQVDLVDIMEDLFPTRTDAMQRLRLNGPQWQTMLDLLDKRDEQTAAEDAAASSLRSETMRILLSRSGEELKRVSQTGFRHLLQEGLFKSAGGEDYYSITSTELSKAKKYLRCCGHQPELLDHWTSALGPGPAFAAMDRVKNINQPDSPARIVLSENQALPEAVFSTGSVLTEASTTKSSISVEPSIQADMLNSSHCTGIPSATSKHSLLPPQLPRSIVSPDPSTTTTRQNLPRASDIQTPLPTPEILLPTPVSAHPQKAQTFDKQPADEGRNDKEEPPPKKRQVSTTKRKSVSFAPAPTPPPNTKGNNTASMAKAATKSTRRKTITPASTPVPVATMIPLSPAALPIPPPDSAPPNPASTTTARRNSMAAPPKPTPPNSANGSDNNNTTSHEHPTHANPTPATNPAPNAQVNNSRRKKSTAPIPSPYNIASGRFPKTPALKAPAPAPKVSTSKVGMPKTAAPKGLAVKKGTITTRRKSSTPAVSKGAGKEQGKFASSRATKGGSGGGRTDAEDIGR